jgi:hypothetical protein
MSSLSPQHAGSHHPLGDLTRVTDFTRHEWGAAGDKAGPWRLGRCDSEMLGAAVPSSYYEIRVSGVLPPEALLDFDRLTASVEPVETVLHGPIQDQAALNGLLARLETFGVEVLEIRRLHGQDPRGNEASHLRRRTPMRTFRSARRSARRVRRWQPHPGLVPFEGARAELRPFPPVFGITHGTFLT